MLKKVLILVALLSSGCSSYIMTSGSIVGDARNAVELKKAPCEAVLIMIDEYDQCEQSKPLWAIFRDCEEIAVSKALQNYPQ